MSMSTSANVPNKYLDEFKVSFSKKNNPKDKDSSQKFVFELHVNAKFDESLLAACFLCGASDKNLRSAQLEWLDDERLLVKCPNKIRQNTLVKALQTPEARQIVTVHTIIAADWDNRQGFKEYREAGGRVITAEAYAQVEEKLRQQIEHNTRLTNEAREANAALAASEERANAEVGRLKAENEELKAAAAGAAELVQKIAMQESVIERGRVERAELESTADALKAERLGLEAMVYTLEQAAATARADRLELIGKIETLEAASIMRVDECAAVELGTKRARVVDVGADDLLIKMQAMLQTTIQATVGDTQLLELKQDCKTKQDQIDALKNVLNKVRNQRNSAESLVKQLKDDNHARTSTNEKLRKRASNSSKTLGWGTRAWTQFLALDPTDSGGIAQLQEQMRDTVTRVARNRYLDLVNVAGMQPHNQASLDRFFGGNGDGADAADSDEDGTGQ